MADAIATDKNVTQNGSAKDRPAFSTLRELSVVSISLGFINFFANYLLSPLFGIYEDDYSFFVDPQSWRSHREFWSYFWDCFVHPPQGRPVGFALDAALSYANRWHSLEWGYFIGWLILTVNAVLLYVILKRASNWFAASVGAAVYLLLPVDLSKMILMHRVLVETSMTFLLIGLLLYTTGRLSLKVVGFLVAILCLADWEGFYLPFLIAPFLEPLPAGRRLRNFVPHAVIFAIPIGIALAIRYTTGEERISAMAHGGTDMLSKMLQAMWVGPTTGLSTFVLRPVETLLAAEAIPKLVGGLVFLSIAVGLWLLSTRLNNGPEASLERAVFLALASMIALVFPYILMYRTGYFPANMTIGRLTCGHAPAAFGYASLGACCAYLGWCWFPRIRGLVGLIVSFYLCVLIAFGIHIQKAEYVEGWSTQKYLWNRLIEQSADADQGMTVLVDVNGLPGSQGFGPLWLMGAAEGNTLSEFVKFPPDWKKPPNVNVYFSWCGYEFKDDGLVLKTPDWDDSKWPTISDGSFLFFRFENGDLKRVVEPVTLFGKEFTPKAIEAKPPLTLTPLGKKLLGPNTSLNWPWLSKALPYGKP